MSGCTGILNCLLVFLQGTAHRSRLAEDPQLRHQELSGIFGLKDSDHGGEWH
jgi:hypothetical protein